MHAMTASLVLDEAVFHPECDDAATDSLDVYCPGLVIAQRCDARTVRRLIDGAHQEGFILAILSQSQSSQLVLAIAPVSNASARISEFSSRGVVLCAASRLWLEEEFGDSASSQYESLLKDQLHFLDADTARLAQALVRSPMKGRMGALFQNAKCRELICSAINQMFSGKLVPLGSDGLSIEDTRRLLEARRLIATNFAEKLTLGSIARSCGLNRTKLAWGFRQMFNRSIAEDLAERRLDWASNELLAGRMSISQIAYSSGYLSHASFSRAFAKHYGVPPKQWRRLENCGGMQFAAC